MPRHRATRESLDDDHAAAAVWAGMRLVAIEGIGRFGLRLWDDKQLSRPRDVLDPLATGEQAVVADEVEAVWQDVNVMSSIMRRRNGLMASSVMGMLLS
jgi:hypothetical protein